jgi:ATP-dependent Clp protease adaptor protein ClpS
MSHKSTYESEGNVILEKKQREDLKEPPRYRVLLHNDDYTTMDFVIYVLTTVFQRSEVDAINIMLQVHTQGVGVAGIYSYEIAETKVAKVLQLAREQEFPLQSSMEPE